MVRLGCHQVSVWALELGCLLVRAWSPCAMWPGPPLCPRVRVSCRGDPCVQHGVCNESPLGAAVPRAPLRAPLRLGSVRCCHLAPACRVTPVRALSVPCFPRACPLRPHVLASHSALSDVSIATLVLPQCLYLRWVPFRQHTLGSFVFI